MSDDFEDPEYTKMKATKDALLLKEAMSANKEMGDALERIATFFGLGGTAAEIADQLIKDGKATPAPSAWREMDSAPKDGTSILAIVPRESDDQPPFFAAQVKWDTFENMMHETVSGWLHEAEQCLCEPTHWQPLQPLPEPPAREEASRG